ncbi:MAG: hypothetical protein FIB02_04390 [Desulfuromonas sp.]|nr:hypothetical protein [Desulfuromonas sp.]
MKSISNWIMLLAVATVMAGVQLISTTTAHAQSTYFSSRGCVNCHVAPTTATCAGCHHHSGTLAATTDKASYVAGETVTVTMTASGARTGWIGARLYNQSGAEVARSTGNQSGMGGSTLYPAVLAAPAPVVAGTYTWKVAYFGNNDGTGTRDVHSEKSVNVTFAVAAPADTTPPTVSVSSPVSAGIVKVNALALNYTVSDGTVKVYVDGAQKNLVSGNIIAGLSNGLHTVRVESTDAANNVGSSEVSFTVDVEPMFVASVADTNGNAVPEVAVLLRDYVSGGYIAYLKDGATKAVVGKVNFGATYLPKGLCAVADMNANGKQELAMLGKSATANAVIIKDSGTGATLRTVLFPVAYEPVALAQVPDVNGNGSNELAVLGVSATGAVAVVVKDIASGVVVKTVGFPSTLKPLALAVVNDVNGNSAPELAVLSAGAGQTKVFVRDAISGAVVNTLSVPATVTPLALVAVPDVNGNGADELTVIVAKATGQFIGVMKDAFTGLAVKNLSVSPAASVPQGATVVGDVNGNAASEIGVLGLSATGAVSVSLKDASSGLAAGAVAYPVRTM